MMVLPAPARIRTDPSIPEISTPPATLAALTKATFAGISTRTEPGPSNTRLPLLSGKDPDRPEALKRMAGSGVPRTTRSPDAEISRDTGAEAANRFASAPQPKSRDPMISLRARISVRADGSVHLLKQIPATRAHVTVVFFLNHVLENAHDRIVVMGGKKIDGLD